MADPKWTDAKFEVVKPRRRGWVWFDWRNFLIVGGLSLIAALRPLLDWLPLPHL
jgi:hypothetical protein